LDPVTGFNAENAQDAAASLFTTTPTHSGISFAYDDMSAIVFCKPTSEIRENNVCSGTPYGRELF
jgi:hypothetical protein